MWRKFGTSSVSMKEVTISSILLGFDKKKHGYKFNNLGLGLGMTLKFYTRVAKSLKLKVWKF